jgi:hypothetical protein
MAHGSQGILKMIRQPKPSNEYAVPRYHVTLVRDNRAVPPSSPLTTSVAAAAVLRPLFAGLDREQFLVCGLDAKHCIIGVNVVSIGSLTLAIIHPREVVQPLILMNAGTWICSQITPPAIPPPARRIASSPADSGRGPTCSASPCLTISFSLMTAATASPIRAGPAPEGSGPHKSGHSDHGARSPVDHLRHRPRHTANCT